MDKKQMFIEVVNLGTGKIFSLPTLYTDRTEACVCGQNYIRDRQAEDPYSEIFFRVLISEDGTVNESYNMRDDDEEPEHGESVYEDADGYYDNPNEEEFEPGRTYVDVMELNP